MSEKLVALGTPPAQKAAKPKQKKPEWLKVRLPSGATYEKVKATLHDLKLHTVCEESRCPNVGECWGGGTATVMVMGDTCTRGCRFCNIASEKRPAPLDPDEPRNLATAVAQLGLHYLVVTSVDRDDIPDQGSSHFAECITELLARTPSTILEVLIPDFTGRTDFLDKIGLANPAVIAHNIETVERLTPTVRDRRAGYRQSLEVLRYVKQTYPHIHTKSSIMLGLGEQEDELLQAFRDLREVGVSVLTLGQYLQPSQWHLEVKEFITPERFAELQAIAEGMGFLYVASGPLVRSSYKAAELFVAGLVKRDREARQVTSFGVPIAG
ncbi:lipoyl synthase [Vulgatibacter incomptus]|uniref:Lipoyl synthase n=1 Tax=Vulgatibacter incomptus TaxID=1391653 RepID=A0A0K1PEA6_9BACT|nr:lipoyl synthase [Vulgatibacter incomptus]AKU91736.1 Lipoate synthase [Vulgatibacter incomptus]